MRSWNAAERTVRARLIFARKLSRLWPDPAVVTDEDVAVFLADVRFSGWTRPTYFGHFRSLFKWLTDTGRIDEDPTSGMRRPTAPGYKPRPLTTHEAHRAYAAAGPDLQAILALGLYAGLRAHEVAKIHSSDVTADTLRVRGKGGREVDLPTHPVIWQLAQSREGFWFPGLSGRDSVVSSTISAQVSRHFEGLGIEGSFHRCRHHYGTSLLRAGVNLRVVQELMRHASLATTAAYLGVDEDEKRAAVLSLAA